MAFLPQDASGLVYIPISSMEHEAAVEALERVPELEAARVGLRAALKVALEERDATRGHAERVEAALRRPLVWDSSVEGEVQALRRRLAEIDAALAPAAGEAGENARLREENEALRELAEARNVLLACYRAGISGSRRAGPAIDRIRKATERLAALGALAE